MKMEPVKITVEIGDHTQVLYLLPKDFKTGSKGWYASDKITLPTGERLQANFQLVIIGSKAKEGRTTFNRG